MHDIETKRSLARLRRNPYKISVLFVALVFIFINWRSSCIPSFSYTDKRPWDSFGSLDCLSLVTFTANMLVWGLIAPLILLSETALGIGIRKSATCDKVDGGYECYNEWSRYWGPYTPYYKVAIDYDQKHKVAISVDTCNVTMVQVLHRHGARYPTKGMGEQLEATIGKIQNQAKAFQNTMAFLKNFKYSFKVDELTPFGEHEMYNSGVKFYRQYQDLSQIHDPFVRVSAQKRVVDSGSFFVKGFNSERSRNEGKQPLPFEPVFIYEGPDFNNTLDHGPCREFEDGLYSETAHEAQTTFAEAFVPGLLPTLKRDLPGVDLMVKDVINLMTMCPFHTLVSEGGQRLSPFCNIFDSDSFKDYDHYLSLGKYYGYGPGNHLGPAQGIGFVNELIARLTMKPVIDHTSTNSTLDENSATFPLDRRIYFDFSHDNTMVSILSALTLFDGEKPLSKTRRPSSDETNFFPPCVGENCKNGMGKHHDGGVHHNFFKASTLVPFAARVYFEKLQCEGIDEALIRIIANDKVMRLKGCGFQRHGACTLSEFVNLMSWARNGGNWAECGWP